MRRTLLVLFMAVVGVAGPLAGSLPRCTRAADRASSSSGGVGGVGGVAGPEFDSPGRF